MLHSNVLIREHPTVFVPFALYEMYVCSFNRWQDTRGKSCGRLGARQRGKRLHALQEDAVHGIRPKGKHTTQHCNHFCEATNSFEHAYCNCSIIAATAERSFAVRARPRSSCCRNSRRRRCESAWTATIRSVRPRTCRYENPQHRSAHLSPLTRMFLVCFSSRRISPYWIPSQTTTPPWTVPVTTIPTTTRTRKRRTTK